MRLRHRVMAILRGGAMDRELDAELRAHLDLETEKYRRQGLDPEAARTKALRVFGGVERVREECRDARGVRGLETFVQDVRYGLRTLAKSPGYTVLAVATLGLGIGANTALFSVIHGVLLKPLPYAEGDRLVLIRQSAPVAGREDVGVSIRELYDYRERLASFTGLVEFHQMSFDLLNRGEPDRVSAGVVSHNFFDVLGIRPLLGRTFTDRDDDAGAEAVLVLSHAYWQSKFGGDPSVVGQVFQMNDRPHTVVGVLPAVPHYPTECDVYMPSSACPFRARGEERMVENRRAFSLLRVFGRLDGTATAERASAEVATVAAQFRQEHPQVYRADETGFLATTVGVREELTRNARPMLLILLGTTGLVLLLACANVANLTLARMLQRDRELAVRTALGAGRSRLLRQLLAESAVVALAGAGAGILFAWATLDLLTAFVGRFTTRTGEIALDPTVLVLTLGVALGTGVVFGVLPAASTKVDLNSALKQGERQGGPGLGQRRLQNALVVAQVAMSAVLLVGAGLLLASFWRLQHVDAGYQPDRVLSAEVFGNFTRYGGVNELRRLYLPILDRLEGEPGVLSAAVTNAVPLSNIQPFDQELRIEGRDEDNRGAPLKADVNIASTRYFETLGIPVLRGRSFLETDDTETTPVVVINQALARAWNDTDPIGTRVSVDGGESWRTVVGIVGDVRQYSLDRAPIAQIYVPLKQRAELAGRVLVRTTGEPLNMSGIVRSAVHAVDPLQPVENIQSLDQLRTNALARPRLTAVLLAVFAGLALVVTLTGLTGVIATSVSQRTREFGVRMALGASRDQVLRMVLGQGLTLVVLGLALGIGLSLVAARVLDSYLYDTSATDPWTLVAVGLAFVAAGVAASVGPAWRATTVNPIVALRSE